MMSQSKPYVVDNILVPTWYAEKMMFQKRLIAYMKHRDLMHKDSAYREEYEKTKKDTKPLYYKDTTDRTRPIIIVGGGGLWYEDMKEKVARMKEQPHPSKRGYTAKRNVREDMYVAIDRRKRQDRGVKVFHIKNNPCAKKEN